MDNDTPRNDLSYTEAMHGMQSGVQLDMQAELGGLVVSDNLIRALKHLRVGINSALVNDAALIRLLVKRGIVTEAEYLEEVRLEANRELDRYEDRLRANFKNAGLKLR